MHRIILSSCVTAAIARPAEDVLLSHKSTNLNANAILTPEEDKAKIDGKYYANRHKMAEKRASFLEKANTVIVPEKRSGLEFEAHLKEQQHKDQLALLEKEKNDLRAELDALQKSQEEKEKAAKDEKRNLEKALKNQQEEAKTTLTEKEQEFENLKAVNDTLQEKMSR